MYQCEVLTSMESKNSWLDSGVGGGGLSGVFPPPRINPIDPLNVLVSPYLTKSICEVATFLSHCSSAYDGVGQHRLVLVSTVHHKNANLIAHCLLSTV